MQMMSQNGLNRVFVLILIFFESEESSGSQITYILAGKCWCALCMRLRMHALVFVMRMHAFARMCC